MATEESIPFLSTLHTSDCIVRWNLLKSKHSIVIVFMNLNTKLYAPLKSNGNILHISFNVILKER